MTTFWDAVTYIICLFGFGFMAWQVSQWLMSSEAFQLLITKGLS